MNVPELLSKRIVFVTGKGGTGKSTLATALGLRAAALGRKAVVVEVDNQKPTLPGFLGVRTGYQPVLAQPNLSICNITWDDALQEWMDVNIPVDRVRKLIMDHKVVRVFLDATPGARETAILSAISSLAERYDLVVVDLPASGHALSLLRVPHITTRMVKAGPLRTRADHLLQEFGRSDTAMVLIALPEEMVVNETVETYQKLRREVPEMQIGMVFLNLASTPSLSPDERTLLHRLSAHGEGSPEAKELLLAGLWEASLEEATAESLERLGEELPQVGVVPFARMGRLASTGDGSAKVVEQMAAALARLATGGKR